MQSALHCFCGFRFPPAFTSAWRRRLACLGGHCPQAGVTRAEAARQAIAETAERERRRSGLAAEVARLADHPLDRAERDRVMADMDAIGAEWPE